MTAKQPKQEGRVNVPLGKHKTRLAGLADQFNTTETTLARVIILNGMAELESGERTFTGPAVMPGK